MLIGWVLGEKFQTYPGQNQDSAFQLTFQQLEKVWEFLHWLLPLQPRWAGQYGWIEGFRYISIVFIIRIISTMVDFYPLIFFLILTFWFKLLLICAEEVRRELQDWLSTCVKHAGGFVWFQSVVSEIFPEFMENTDFDRPTQSGKCLIDSGFIFLLWQLFQTLPAQ